ncbi:Amidohydrolase family protein [Candida albicans]|uniref:Amidohydrolase family protein n=1 Tax=Candida albicans TaxID=5476 RepID=A0A8H6C5I9_CANAX|nr:Amidohydrolase family protein [Candida albicans]
MLTHYVKLSPGKDWFIQNGGNSAVGKDRPNLEEVVEELKELGATQVITEEQNNSKEFGPTIKGWIKESGESGTILEIVDRVLPPNDPILARYNVFPIDYRNVTPAVIMPGLVDAHVHLNEPGRTEWEGFETGTKAAASGGVTTVIDMPLNAIPPTTTVANFNLKINAAKARRGLMWGFGAG